jgi:hypothetical protein
MVIELIGREPRYADATWMSAAAVPALVPDEPAARSGT